MTTWERPMSGSESAAWMCGVVYAAGYLARLGDDVRARELLEEIGVDRVGQLRDIDCPDYDVDGVRRLLPEIRRRTKRKG